MPQIICKNLPSDTVRELSRELTPLLARLNETPEDYYSFEAVASERFCSGCGQGVAPLIEIKQFPRKKEAEKESARLILEALHTQGYTCAELFYTHLCREDYYEWDGGNFIEY